MADVISNIIDDKQDIKNQLGSLPNTLKVPFRFTEDVEPVVVTTKLESVSLDGTTLVWDSNSQGDWDDFDWGDNTSFPTELYAVLPINNVFVEYFDQNMFISSSSTGTLNTTTETYTLADTQILESNVIAKLRTPINSVTPAIEGTGTYTISVSNDGTNWFTATNNTKYTFASSASTDELYYRITATSTVVISKVTMGVNQ